MTLAQYQTWLTEVIAPTAPMFRLVPPESLGWQLTPASFTVGQILAHIPRSLSFNAVVLGGGEPPARSMREIFVANRRQPAAGVEEALGMLEEGVGAYRRAMEGIGEARFAGGMIDTPQLGSIPVWRFGLFVAEHHIHHLMELHLSLKALGVKVHTGTLYRG